MARRCGGGLFISLLAAVLLAVPTLAAPATAAPDAATPSAAPVRLAVLAEDISPASRALADLLTVELARRPGIETVERDELDRVLREQALTAAGLVADGVRGRVAVGRLLQARMLILVGTVPEANGGGAYSIVCDVSTGARLSHWRWSRATTNPEALAEQALDVLSRFPDGVKTLVSIPDFISRDLMLRYAHLQADLAEVLRQSLADVPGLALVEVAEAKSIAAEMELTGERVACAMRLQVEGEYRTDALADGGPSIDIRIAIFDGGRCITELASGAIPLGHAGRFVGIKARARLHQMLNLPPQESMEQKRSGPLLLPDGSLLCDRVRLVPLSLRVLDDHGNADKPLEGFRWRALGGWTHWKQLVPAWQGIDAVFAPGALLLVDKELVARPILVNPEVYLSHVVFDGRYLWAASGYAGGLFVYDQQGALVAHVREGHGLPPSSHSMPIVSLNEGRIMATGSIGGFGGRGWIAIVELHDGEPVVRVIHEAIEVVQTFMDFEEQKNTRRRFDPSWISGHRDEDGRQWVFVDRRNLPLPLIVDAATGIVTVYSAPEFKAPDGFPRSEGPETAFLSRAGAWHVAGSDNGFRSYRLDRQTRCLVRQKTLEDAPRWHSGNAKGGSLVEDAGWLYYAGSRRWTRRNLATGLDETLVDDRRSLPEYGSGNAWNLAVSRTHGLVAWIGDKLFKVVLPDYAPRSEIMQ